MDRLPILPLGQLVVYPHVVLPMALADPNAVQLIDEVVQGNKRLLLGVVKPLSGTEPPEGAIMQARPEELYEVGTLGSVVRMLKLGDGSVRVMVQGLERARLVEISPAEHWLVAGYETLVSTTTEDARTEALKRTVHAQFSRVIDIAPYLGEELHEVLSGITDGSKLADFAAANLDLALPAKAELLAIDDVNRRLERLAELLGQELQVLEVGTQIQEKVKSRLDANQREYVLREQLRVIRQELARPEYLRSGGAALHARVARRRAGRSRGARPPAHLRRRPPRPHHPRAATLRDAQSPADARRGGQDGRRRPGRPHRGAARGARPRPERHVRRSLPRGPVRPLGRDVHRHRQQPRADPRPVARPDGSSHLTRVHPRREARHREALPAAAAAQGDGPHRGAGGCRRRGPGAADRGVHARGRRAAARA